MLMVVLPPAGPGRTRLLFLDELPYALPRGCVAAAEVTLTQYPTEGPPTGLFLDSGVRRHYHLHPPDEVADRLLWVAADCYTARTWGEFADDHPDAMAGRPVTVGGGLTAGTSR